MILSLFSKKTKAEEKVLSFKDFAAELDKITAKLDSLEATLSTPSSNADIDELKAQAKKAAIDSKRLLKESADRLALLLPSDKRSDDGLCTFLKATVSELESLTASAVFNSLVIEREILPLAKKLHLTVENAMFI